MKRLYLILAIILSLATPAAGQGVGRFVRVVLDGTVTVRTGTGSPEGSVVGVKGDIFLRSDGGAGTTFYVKQSGTGDTGWSAFAGTGTVTSVTCGSGLSGGAITTSGTCDIAAGGVTNTMLAGSIAASKLIGSDIATVGTVTSGTWSATTIAVNKGGTGLTAGTSGGVLAFTASGTLASSGALTANLPVIGGGAGVAPTVGTRSGNTTQYVTTTGTQTSGDCVQIDASGNHVAAGASCGGGGGGAPTSAQYVTLATNGSLSDERVLTAGSGISITDGGAGSTVTIASTTQSLLAYTAYNPGTPASTSTSSSTFADVDATNLTVTFTAPASGNVLVRLTAVAVVNNVAAVYAWNLRTTGGSNVSGSFSTVTSNGNQIKISSVVPITGLTPGASTTWRWGHAVSSNTGSVRYGDSGTISASYGPAVMEVWAAP